jgi:mono/diheme cytochrome c family protein
MAPIFGSLMSERRCSIKGAAFRGLQGHHLVQLVLGFVVSLCASLPGLGAELAPTHGLRAAFRDSAQGSMIQDIEIHRNVALYVPSAEFATPFLESKEFVVEWSGFLSVAIRDDYRFRVFVSGDFELELNGERVLVTVDGEGWSEPSEEIRLNKGANAVKAVFRSDPKRDAAIRLEWSSLDFLFEPIQTNHWSYHPDDESGRHLDLRAGRTLFISYRCGACHVDTNGAHLNDNLLSGVNLDGIGERRRTGWLKDWIRDPGALRKRTKMPAVFRGEEALGQVSAVVAFLNHEPGKGSNSNSPILEGNADSGQKLYSELNCAGCHELGKTPTDNEDRILLSHVGQKFGLNALVDFLRNPSEHYPAIQMPDFGLTLREASNLATFLIPRLEPDNVEPTSSEISLVEKGRDLMAQGGCVNCHEGLRDGFGGLTSRTGIEIVNAENGCLSSEVGRHLEVPQFVLSDEDRRVLRLFLNEGDRASIKRVVVRESAERYQASIRCSACHGELEGIPPVGHFGAKLKADWMSRLFKGETEQKSRSWIAARMPAFPAYADQLAIGLSHGYGYSGLSGIHEVIDDELAKVGRQLISPVGGFSCVSCHGVGELRPTQVFESEGINFALSGARLRKDYFRRWILNPLRIDPLSKMPVYFDEEGMSPLYDVLDGDTDRQLNAIWHYLLQGNDMIPPALE